MDNDAKLRPFYLAKILYERTDIDHYLTTNQLIRILEDEYGMSGYRSTIGNDIEMLNSIGLIQVKAVKSRQNRYRVIERRFDLAELKLLIDAVQSSKFISREKSAQLTEKLGTLASTFQAEKLKRNLSVEGQVKGDNERLYNIIDAINEGINSRRMISFRYISYGMNKHRVNKNNGEDYVFSPFNLVWNGDHYYVVGWSEKHGGIGTFRVDRIDTIPDILDEKAHPIPKSFKINTYINTMFHMYSSEREEVELICAADTMNAFVDKFGEKIEILKVDDYTFRTTVKVAVNHVFYSWIFGFGGKVKIEGPGHVQNGYKEMLKEACKSAGV